MLPGSSLGALWELSGSLGACRSCGYLQYLLHFQQECNALSLTEKTFFITDRTFENPLNDPEARVEALLTTICGQLDVTDLNTSSFTLAQENQTKTYFRNAITTSLCSGLPQGFIVKVISQETGQQR